MTIVYYFAFNTALDCVSIATAQRSAQELPLVEKQSVDSYPVTGGKMMLVSGLNFLPDSKVVFVEKAQGKPPLPPHTHVYCLPNSPLISLSNVSFPLALPRVSPVSTPVKIEQPGQKRHMWCALSCYIFNQSVFTFAIC